MTRYTTNLISSMVTATQTSKKFGRTVAACSIISLLGAASAHSAPRNDEPWNASPFSNGTAENGPVTDLQKVIEFEGATADAGVSSCFGRRSFTNTAWLRVEAAATYRRISVEAWPQTLSTITPDLALFVQPGYAFSNPFPSSCSGRETERSTHLDGRAAASRMVIAPGRQVFVQIGWRASDPKENVVASLTTTDLGALPTPSGSTPGAAPKLSLNSESSFSLQGASTTHRDTAQPRCQSEAAVWRSVRAKRRGYYVAVAKGETVSSLTSFKDFVDEDNATACESAGDNQSLAVVFKAKRHRRFQLRIGTDQPEVAADAKVVVMGPYQTRKMAGAAAAAVDVVTATQELITAASSAQK